ncbi:MFS general substrate transporter [Aspergillus fijiensis CBS 313.89]|uniref:MFS general substrate transporter n=1 Tax=Aspergillus fijiensis CBS 313.89 TaxID=1448319 RepID=A0A8G1RTN6_9EURO|nr:MFS general substrate transporter [Aspergillus fijiensis CBS 313.89]RAK79295.1 MFS general substrate transporter [Aspergillus fijiensis CBS 313.89]
MFTKLRAPFRRSTTDEAGTAVTLPSPSPVDGTSSALPGEKNVEAGVAPTTDSTNTDSDEEHPESTEDQAGTFTVEAITATWTKASLIAVFINIWFLYFVNAFQVEILSTLVPYLTSAWDSHSLLNVIYVVSDCCTAAIFIPLAKMMDVWGRAEGFAFMAIISTMGLIIMAACHNLPTFCAGYVFYNVGFSGITFCVDTLTADASQLRNRALAYAFTSSPYIISAFAGPKAGEDALGMSMRWAFGAFAIIFPVVAAPLYCILRYNTNKAKKEGRLVRERSGRTLTQNIWFWAMEFDVVGVLLFSAGLVVFFLPFDIASMAPHGWKTGYIIAMIVVGFSMIVFFAIWEYYFARVPFMKLKYLTDRTVLGACLLDATYQVCYYCWDSYFTSFLQVVNDLSVADAGYVNNTFDVVSGVLLLFIGWLISRTGKFRWLLYWAVPLYIFAQGLMIYFRRPNQNVGYLVMCQIFISIGGSVFILVQQLAVEAAVDHRHVAATLALLNVVGTVADGIGSTISGAIWTNTFEKGLYKYLPADALPDIDDIYEDIDTQLSYPVGSAVRTAIQEAYGYAQTRMLAVGTGLFALAFIWMFMIRDIDLRKKKQVHGMVW